MENLNTKSIVKLSLTTSINPTTNHPITRNIKISLDLTSNKKKETLEVSVKA